MKFELKNTKIVVIGLGYVGLPLAIEFSKKYPTIGYDIKKSRVDELRLGHDSTLEVSSEDLLSIDNLYFTSEELDIKDANVYIVTVPTPVDINRQPDLNPLIKASEVLGRNVNLGDVLIYESTVYPGATEEDCIPVVERISGLKFNKDFYAGYSPERVNPGDKDRPISKIKKVTSGSTLEVANYVDMLYKSIISAGTYKASSIRVAEASKIIENTQRDVNIALINELAMIFTEMGINTHEVIEAASTKWNFIKLQPGLVGGHCIGVDPYYLMHKSMVVGHIPDMIRTAREINDGMPRFVASMLIKNMVNNEQKIKHCKALVMGVTFKENCPDIRNTKVVDLVSEMKSYGLDVDLHDPWVDAEEFRREFNLSLVSAPIAGAYGAIVIAVGHNAFKDKNINIRSFGANKCTIIDMKNILSDRNYGQITF